MGIPSTNFSESKSQSTMRSLKIVLLAAGLLSVVGLQAQTVDEIINKYFEALGGKDKVAALKTMHAEYDGDMNSAAISGTVWIVNEKAMKNDMEFMGQHLTQCYTDTSGWLMMPGQTTPTAMTAEQVKGGKGPMDMAGFFYNYAAKGNTIGLAGKETVDGKDTYKLKIKTKAGQEVLAWIDAATWYLIKVQSTDTFQGTEVTSTMRTSNYKKTEDGFILPFTAEFSMSTGLTFSFNYKKIEINKDIDMTIFAMPKQ